MMITWYYYAQFIVVERESGERDKELIQVVYFMVLTGRRVLSELSYCEHMNIFFFLRIG